MAVAKKDYQTFVYQTDVDPEKFRGAFFDEKDADGWVKKQEGTYEVSTERPTDRKERLAGEAAGDQGGGA